MCPQQQLNGFAQIQLPSQCSQSLALDFSVLCNASPCSLPEAALDHPKESRNDSGSSQGETAARAALTLAEELSSAPLQRVNNSVGLPEAQSQPN